MDPISDTRFYTPEGPETELRINCVPSIPKLFTRLIALSFVRNSHMDEDATIDNVKTIYEGWRLDPAQVCRFKSVCGYTDEGHPVPAPYIQTLFIGLVSRFISSAHFPINPMGLIQIGQSFRLERPIALSEPLDLTCSLSDMTQTPKGITTRMSFEAKSKGDVVWQGIATYFTRAKNPPPKDRSAKPTEEGLPVREIIRVAANTGRRYAGRIPRLQPPSSVPVDGKTHWFQNRPSPMAPGALPGAGASLEKGYGYPEHFEMEGALKLPIFLPATITLGYEKQGEDILFELRDEKRALPHLKGIFRI